MAKSKSDVPAVDTAALIKQGLFDSVSGVVRRFRHPMERVRLSIGAPRVVGVSDDGSSIYHPDDIEITHQSFRDSTDVNNIIRQFDRTGILPVPPGREPKFGDVSNLNRDLTSLVEDSRLVAEAVTRVAANRKAADAKKAADDAAELKRFRDAAAVAQSDKSNTK